MTPAEIDELWVRCNLEHPSGAVRAFAEAIERSVLSRGVRCWVVWDSKAKRTAVDVADRPCWYQLKRHATQEMVYQDKYCEVRPATLTIEPSKGGEK